MTTVLAFIILLGILIFFHELGHFLLAKANRVGVLKFSLGFGPAILKKRIGETEYRLSIFPLGGYVKMLGEDPDQEDTLPIDPQKSFTNKSLGAKASIVAAGPVSNLVLAIIIYTIIAWIGIPAFAPVVADVQEDSPAYHAGLLSGDTILSIEKNPIKTWDDISLIVQEVGAGKAVEMEIEREGTIFTVLVSPVITKAQNIFGEEIDRALIGITRTDTIITQHFGVIGGISYGFGQSYRIIELTGIAFWKIVNGTIDIKKSLGGPIMIADVSGQTLKAGALPFLSLIAFISINLVLINLLPIPILDGGHLLFFIIEGITGRPVEGRPREIAQQIGLFLLVLLMLLAFYNDITRIMSGD